MLQNIAEELMLELMPIFERVRQREELPCAYPLQVGSGGSFQPATITHSPSYHWVMFAKKKLPKITQKHSRNCYIFYFYNIFGI